MPYFTGKNIFQHFLYCITVVAHFSKQTLNRIFIIFCKAIEVYIFTLSCNSLLSVLTIMSCNSRLWSTIVPFWRNLKRLKTLDMIILRTPLTYHVIPFLYSLHWLPVQSRIQHKLCSLYPSVSGFNLKYLSYLSRTCTVLC